MRFCKGKSLDLLAALCLFLNIGAKNAWVGHFRQVYKQFSSNRNGVDTVGGVVGGGHFYNWL
jgi:hypothetical protein